MALQTLYKIKANTYLDLPAGYNYSTVVPGGVAAVNSAGFLVVGADNEPSPVGIFQVQGFVPPYQSTGLLDAQINGATGSYLAGVTVSYLSGAGAMMLTDQVISLNSIPIGSYLVGGANGMLKAQGVSTAPVIAILVGVSVQPEGTFAAIQMRI